MNGKQHIKECLRTASCEYNIINVNLEHGAMGCSTEANEILDVVKKSKFYGKKIDRTHLIEELGDLAWYMSLIMSELKTDWSEVWDVNIKKLRTRYPDKFTSENAIKRNTDAEKDVLEKEIK